jgi:hypothetical protein
MIALFIALLCIHTFAWLHLIGTLAKMCEGCGVGAKPEDDVWWIHPEDGRTGKCLEERCSPSEFHLTNTNLSQILGKP